MAHDRNAASLDSMETFPPTVVDHSVYRNSIVLELLDSGKTEEPRYIEIFDNGEVDRSV